MIEQKSRELVYFKLPVFLTDLAIHLLTLRYVYDGRSKGIFLYLAFAFTISIIFMNLRLHERKIKVSVVVWRAFLQTFLTYVFFTVFLSIVFKVTPRRMVAEEMLITMPLIAVLHFCVNKLVRCFRSFGYNTRNVVIIGADEVARRLYKEMEFGQTFTGYRVIGYFTSLDKYEMPKEVKKLGTVEDCFDWLKDNRPDEVYCSLPPATCEAVIDRIIQICNDKFMDFYYVPTMDGYPHRQMAFRNFGKVTVIKLREEPMNNPLAKLYKRVTDIVISGLFLCTLYPFVFLFVWIGDLVTGSKGPVYFRQARTGYNGKSFMIYKFRSMKVNADADKLQATKDDPRKTKFGDFLRKSSIDELPQFINVLKGDMSIIGPRPHMEFHTEMYSSLIGDYMVRHLAKPGITGWAQISGCRGETKTVEEMKDRVEHDIWYIEHWTPLLDLVIFLRTIWQVIPGHDKQAY